MRIRRVVDHRQPTLKDVAKAANVSKTTASAALNNTGRMHDSTRELVQQIAKELGYRPWATGRSLQKGNRSRIVALVIHGFSLGENSHAMPQLWRRLNDELITGLSRHSISFIAIPAKQLDLLATSTFDAVMVINPPDLQAAVPAEVPAGCPVIVAPWGSFPQTPGVEASLDFQVDTSLALTFDHLVQAGAKHPALLYNELPLMPVTAFTSTYDSWCASNGVIPIVFASVTRESVREAVRLGADAFFVKGSDIDRSPEKVIEYLGEIGLRVPDDVLVASNSEDLNEPQAAVPITCLTWASGSTGDRIVQMLVSGFANGKFESITLPFELRKRRSTQRI